MFWLAEPFLKITKFRSKVIFAMNSSVARELNLHPKKVVCLPSVGSEKMQKPGFSKDQLFTVLSVGRFVPLKGFDVTINSFAEFYHLLPPEDQPFAQLILVGKGPSEEQLKDLVSQKEISHAVTFIPWIEREKLLGIYQKAKVFLFPSHEGAGMVVSESLSMGLPVLCFDNCGPGEFIDENCGFKVAYQNYSESISEFAEHLLTLFYNPQQLYKMSASAYEKHRLNFDWNLKGEVFRKAYESISSSQINDIEKIERELPIPVNSRI